MIEPGELLELVSGQRYQFHLNSGERLIEELDHIIYATTGEPMVVFTASGKILPWTSIAWYYPMPYSNPNGEPHA